MSGGTSSLKQTTHIIHMLIINNNYNLCNDNLNTNGRQTEVDFTEIKIECPENHVFPLDFAENFE